MGVGAILLAAGSATRLGGDGDKIYVPIAGRPLLAYPLEAFAEAPSVTHIVVVDRAAYRDRTEVVVEAYGGGKVFAVVAGGAHRQASESAGLDALQPLVEAGDIDVIAIHDSARPLVPVDLIERLAAAARLHGGAVPGLPVGSMAAEVDGGAVRLIAPGSLVRMQTPQVYAAGALLAAYRASAAAGDAPAVDTAEVMERHSSAVTVVEPGDERNLKVTYAADLAECERLARSWDI